MIQLDERAINWTTGRAASADRVVDEFRGFSDKMNPSPPAREVPAEEELVFVSPPPAPFPRILPGL
jgi:hypothetical protein